MFVEKCKRNNAKIIGRDLSDKKVYCMGRAEEKALAELKRKYWQISQLRL